MWEALFKRYWLVSTFKESPANTPYSLLLLATVAFLFFILIIWQWFMADMKRQFDLLYSIAAAASLLAAYCLYTFLLLKLNKKKHRIVQTLTSLWASHFIIHLFALPLLLMAPILANANLGSGLILLAGIIYLILTLVLTVWQFLITAYIYRYALDVDYLTSILVSFGLLACNILTVSFWQ
ncbi:MULTISPECIES: hypothetical protein [unclassified Legionella]|uniref:hypothetical protein n=1 Tax=unclassified Legionella TaxID=2622702 RepID=UPI001054D605|nr:MULTISPECIES: hypothetical protein [unclassified Legionella]MDI9817662.1 hypothetical protein [Legionella sp. PL877]